MTRKPKPSEPRTRTRGAVPAYESATEVKTHAGILTLSAQSSVPGNGEYEIMHDVVTRGFAPGRRIVSNPMKYEMRNQYSAGNGYLITQISGGSAVGDTFEGNSKMATKILMGFIGSQGPWFKPAYETSWGWQAQAAIEEASTKAQRVPSDANLLVSIAEYKQALGMVPSIWKQWSHFLRRVKAQAEVDYQKYLRGPAAQRKVLQGLTLGDVVNSTYLMARFGVRPLIADTQAVVDIVLRAATSEKLERQTMRGSVEYTESQDRESVVAMGVLRTPVKAVDTHLVNIRAMRLLEARFDAVRDAGLALNQIPEAAIDVVSYSFVVNWLVNVNDYISAVSEATHSDWRELTSCMVATREATTVCHITGSSSITQPTVYRLDRSPEGILSVTYKTKQRTIGLPPPSLTVRARPFKWLGDFRALDAIALVRNLIQANHQSFMRRIG